ncbi:MAG TPA: alpha/beta fold hydrolase [Ensifer sp.]|jgi:phospholipase/carboxylesterase|uniref:alpha/beta hydrolase n=1 Tax=Ensifer sp. TaxID=1872086 RepID=UPI002E13C217|nr:alpha/beta fold hydrolase [Ensifer sp.]
MLICLHGSSGSPKEWGSFPEAIAPHMRIHRLKGEIPDNGGHTFFSKRPDRSLDPAEMAARADQLAVRIVALASGSRAPLLLGFSSGATIAAAAIQRHPALAAGAILLRPEPPFAAPPFADPPTHRLEGLPILILAGAHDERRAPDAADVLARQLRAVGAAVDLYTLDIGHAWQPDGLDQQLARDWIARLTVK